MSGAGATSDEAKRVRARINRLRLDWARQFEDAGRASGEAALIGDALAEADRLLATVAPATVAARVQFIEALVRTREITAKLRAGVDARDAAQDVSLASALARVRAELDRARRNNVATETDASLAAARALVESNAILREDTFVNMALERAHSAHSAPGEQSHRVAATSALWDTLASVATGHEQGVADGDLSGATVADALRNHARTWPIVFRERLPGETFPSAFLDARGFRRRLRLWSADVFNHDFVANTLDAAALFDDINRMCEATRQEVARDASQRFTVAFILAQHRSHTYRNSGGQLTCVPIGMPPPPQDDDGDDEEDSLEADVHDRFVEFVIERYIRTSTPAAEDVRDFKACIEREFTQPMQAATPFERIPIRAVRRIAHAKSAEHAQPVNRYASFGGPTVVQIENFPGSDEADFARQLARARDPEFAEENALLRDNLTRASAELMGTPHWATKALAVGPAGAAAAAAAAALTGWGKQFLANARAEKGRILGHAAQVAAHMASIAARSVLVSAAQRLAQQSLEFYRRHMQYAADDAAVRGFTPEVAAQYAKGFYRRWAEAVCAPFLQRDAAKSAAERAAAETQQRQRLVAATRPGRGEPPQMDFEYACLCTGLGFRVKQHRDEATLSIVYAIVARILAETTLSARVLGVASRLEQRTPAVAKYDQYLVAAAAAPRPAERSPAPEAPPVLTHTESAQEIQNANAAFSDAQAYAAAELQLRGAEAIPRLVRADAAAVVPPPPDASAPQRAASLVRGARAALEAAADPDADEQLSQGVADAFRMPSAENMARDDELHIQGTLVGQRENVQDAYDAEPLASHAAVADDPEDASPSDLAFAHGVLRGDEPDAKRDGVPGAGPQAVVVDGPQDQHDAPEDDGRAAPPMDDAPPNAAPVPLRNTRESYADAFRRIARVRDQVETHAGGGGGGGGGADDHGDRWDAEGRLRAGYGAWRRVRLEVVQIAREQWAIAGRNRVLLMNRAAMALVVERLRTTAAKRVLPKAPAIFEDLAQFVNPLLPLYAGSRYLFVRAIDGWLRFGASDKWAPRSLHAAPLYDGDANPRLALFDTAGAVADGSAPPMPVAAAVHLAEIQYAILNGAANIARPLRMRGRLGNVLVTYYVRECLPIDAHGRYTRHVPYGTVKTAAKSFRLAEREFNETTGSRRVHLFADELADLQERRREATARGVHEGQAEWPGIPARQTPEEAARARADRERRYYHYCELPGNRDRSKYRRAVPGDQSAEPGKLSDIEKQQNALEALMNHHRPLPPACDPEMRFRQSEGLTIVHREVWDIEALLAFLERAAGGARVDALVLRHPRVTTPGVLLAKRITRSDEVIRYDAENSETIRSELERAVPNTAFSTKTSIVDCEPRTSATYRANLATADEDLVRADLDAERPVAAPRRYTTSRPFQMAFRSAETAAGDPDMPLTVPPPGVLERLMQRADFPPHENLVEEGGAVEESRASLYEAYTRASFFRKHLRNSVILGDAQPRVPVSADPRLPYFARETLLCIENTAAVRNASRSTERPYAAAGIGAAPQARHSSVLFRESLLGQIEALRRHAEAAARLADLDESGLISDAPPIQTLDLVLRRLLVFPVERDGDDARNLRETCARAMNPATYAAADALEANETYVADAWGPVGTQTLTASGAIHMYRGRETEAGATRRTNTRMHAENDKGRNIEQVLAQFKRSPNDTRRPTFRPPSEQDLMGLHAHHARYCGGWGYAAKIDTSVGSLRPEDVNGNEDARANHARSTVDGNVPLLHEAGARHLVNALRAAIGPVILPAEHPPGHNGESPADYNAKFAEYKRMAGVDREALVHPGNHKPLGPTVFWRENMGRVRTQGQYNARGLEQARRERNAARRALEETEEAGVDEAVIREHREALEAAEARVRAIKDGIKMMGERKEEEIPDELAVQGARAGINKPVALARPVWGRIPARNVTAPAAYFRYSMDAPTLRRGWSDEEWTIKEKKTANEGNGRDKRAHAERDVEPLERSLVNLVHYLLAAECGTARSNAQRTVTTPLYALYRSAFWSTNWRDDRLAAVATYERRRRPRDVTGPQAIAAWEEAETQRARQSILDVLAKDAASLKARYLMLMAETGSSWRRDLIHRALRSASAQKRADGSDDDDDEEDDRAEAERDQAYTGGAGAEDGAHKRSRLTTKGFDRPFVLHVLDPRMAHSGVRIRRMGWIVHSPKTTETANHGTGAKPDSFEAIGGGVVLPFRLIPAALDAAHARWTEYCSHATRPHLRRPVRASRVIVVVPWRGNPRALDRNGTLFGGDCSIAIDGSTENLRDAADVRYEVYVYRPAERAWGAYLFPDTRYTRTAAGILGTNPMVSTEFVTYAMDRDDEIHGRTCFCLMDGPTARVGTSVSAHRARLSARDAALRDLLDGVRSGAHPLPDLADPGWVALGTEGDARMEHDDGQLEVPDDGRASRDGGLFGDFFLAALDQDAAPEEHRAALQTAAAAAAPGGDAQPLPGAAVCAQAVEAARALEALGAAAAPVAAGGDRDAAAVGAMHAAAQDAAAAVGRVVVGLRSEQALQLPVQPPNQINMEELRAALPPRSQSLIIIPSAVGIGPPLPGTAPARPVAPPAPPAPEPVARAQAPPPPPPGGDIIAAVSMGMRNIERITVSIVAANQPVAAPVAAAAAAAAAARAAERPDDAEEEEEEEEEDDDDDEDYAGSRRGKRKQPVGSARKRILRSRLRSDKRRPKPNRRDDFVYAPVARRGAGRRGVPNVVSAERAVNRSRRAGNVVFNRRGRRDADAAAAEALAPRAHAAAARAAGGADEKEEEEEAAAVDLTRDGAIAVAEAAAERGVDRASAMLAETSYAAAAAAAAQRDLAQARRHLTPMQRKTIAYYRAMAEEERQRAGAAAAATMAAAEHSRAVARLQNEADPLGGDQNHEAPIPPPLGL